MKFRHILLLISILLIASCTSKTGNMQINGKIKGLHKGTVYLEKIVDTLLVKVDSVVLEGNNTFVLSDNIDSPQIYFLSIAGTNKILQFFGEKGEISIKADLNTYGFKPIITGSKNQEYMDVYRATNTKFNNLKLDLIAKKFDAAKFKDSNQVAIIEKKINNILKRKYLYTANFAVNHADYEIAPYLALSKIYDANPKILDTIIKSMSPKIAKSLYGKKLIEYVNKNKN